MTVGGAGKTGKKLASARAKAMFAHETLLAWFRVHRREMPWRGHPSPYAVWVSEIMLQQTQVETVKPFFDRFMAKYPTVRHLAEAELEAVLALWQGLGYYTRARNLHRAAKDVAARPEAALPRTAAALAALPGVGDYTAAAIASICFGERVPVVDGNVARVFARHDRLGDDFRAQPPRRALAKRLQPAFDATESPGDLNQAMMELGALVCRPRNPDCAACPLAADCEARKRGEQAAYPRRTPKAPPPVRHAVAVLLRRGGRWLLVRREGEGLLGGSGSCREARWRKGSRRWRRRGVWCRLGPAWCWARWRKRGRSGTASVISRWCCTCSRPRRSPGAAGRRAAGPCAGWPMPISPRCPWPRRTGGRWSWEVVRDL